MEKKSTKPNVSTVTKNVAAKAAEPVKAVEPVKAAEPVKAVEPVKAAETKAVVEKKAEEIAAGVTEVKKAAGRVKEKATKKARAAKAAKAALKPEILFSSRIKKASWKRQWRRQKHSLLQKDTESLPLSHFVYT